MSNALRLVRGDSRRVKVTLQLPNASGVLQPYPVALGQHEVVFTVKRSTDDPDPGVLRKTLSGGGVAIDGSSANVVYAVIGPSDTANLTGVYWYDVQVREIATGDVQTPILDRLTVVADVSRA